MNHRRCRIELEFVDQQVPGKLDRVFLEVIAKRKIAEHLEKRLMPRGLADFVQIVVLAAGAHAFLRRAGAHVVALLDAQKDILELVHAGVGEEQRRIVGRQQGRRAHARMPVPLEVLQKSFANFVSSHKSGVTIQKSEFRINNG